MGDNLHPWYGPCDAFLSDGSCSECHDARTGSETVLADMCFACLAEFDGDQCETCRRLRNLAANLVWGAALCAAFTQGQRETKGPMRCGRYNVEPWTPGCQRPAPGFERGGGR